MPTGETAIYPNHIPAYPDNTPKDLRLNIANVFAAGLMIAALPCITPALLMRTDDAWGYGSFNGMSILMVLVVIVLLVGLLLMIIWNRRRLALVPVLIAYLIGSGAAVASIYTTYPISRQLWVEKLEALAVEAAPVTDAIKHYQADTGHLPDKLSALVPKYLPEIPRPQKSETSEFYYSREVLDAPDPWKLSVSFAGAGFDQFIYLPSEQYPKNGWGGHLEPIANWAYFHE